MSKETPEEELLNKFTYKELRQIWKPLTDYVNHIYVQDITTTYKLELKKRWIHFYSKEDFTVEETICTIEDYTVLNNEEQIDLQGQKTELRSIRGH